MECRKKIISHRKFRKIVLTPYITERMEQIFCGFSFILIYMRSISNKIYNFSLTNRVSYYTISGYYNYIER